MELVKEMIEIQAERELKRANNGNTTFKGFDGSDVIVTYNGVQIGRLQSVTTDATYESEPSEVGSPWVRETTIVGQQAEVEVDYEAFRQLILGETVSVSYDWEESYQQPNRAERRARPAQKHDEELQNGYRKGIRSMLGGRNKWN